jgi:hypothetical protein
MPPPATPGRTPYAATGYAWPHPQLVTLSFVPDGTVLALGNGGQITSNLFESFGKIPGVTSPTQWQNIILKAAQSWAAQTNVNFAVVPDDGSAAGSGSYQQGAPNFGDIRIGGYDFGSSSNWLASTFYPPSVNNYSVAGDVAFNTSYGFNIGSTYDLFTVAEHEIGHALGLACCGTSSAVMYTTYTGAYAGLGSDDIAGARSIYSAGNPRSVDTYDAGSGDNFFSSAANITSAISPSSLTAVLNNLSITSAVGSQDTVTSADVAYYKFTAPCNSASTMTVSVQSAGLSLLSPLVTVYASNQTTALGTATAKGQYGATLTLSGIPVTPGSTYYVKVQGADTSVFSTGAYALTLNLGTGANPVVPRPNTQTANGNPVSSGGGVPMEPATHPSAGVAGLLSPVQAVVNLATGVLTGLLGGSSSPSTTTTASPGSTSTTTSTPSGTASTSTGTSGGTTNTSTSTTSPALSTTSSTSTGSTDTLTGSISLTL